MSSQIIPLKARADSLIRTESRPRRPLAFELQRRGYAARAPGETLITLSPPRQRRDRGMLCPSTKARVSAVSPFPRAELHDYDVLAEGETEAPSAVIVQLASSRSEKNGF